MYKEEDIMTIILSVTEIPKNDLSSDLDLLNHGKMGKVKFNYLIYGLESSFGIFFPSEPFQYNTPKKLLDFINNKKRSIK